MSLKPGRELDALLAEKVIGLDPKWFNVSQSYYEAASDGPRLKPYSTDISAAWRLLECFERDPEFFDDRNYQIMFKRYSPCNVVCSFYLQKSLDEYRSDQMIHFEAEGENAPHALCLVALEAAPFIGRGGRQDRWAEQDREAQGPT